MNEKRDRLKELLQEADRIPPVPDCRDAVMAGINERKTGMRPAWVYACAAVIALAVASGSLMLRGPDPVTKRPVVEHRATVPQPSPQKKQVAKTPPTEP